MKNVQESIVNLNMLTIVENKIMETLKKIDPQSQEGKSARRWRTENYPQNSI